ncbi:MAG TPA: ATP cone domain-containing protein, partial [Spongiibacteraceae bacterium]|nr:ATP cone domain-containing protein [Spongiibacteraceae bacterium]
MHADLTTSTSGAQTTPTNAPAGGTAVPASVQATAPGQIRVIKRNGTVVSYDDSKIAVAITKAFLAVEGGTAAASTRIHETVAKLSAMVSATFKRRMPSGGTIHIEDIQDQVELSLMRSGEQKVARSYVIYREEHARARAAKASTQPTKTHPTLHVTLADGSREFLDLGRLETIVAEACADLEGVDAQLVLGEALKNLYDGVPIGELSTSLVITARTLVEQEPNYSFVTARLLMDSLREEALTFLGVAKSATQADMTEYYPQALAAYIEKGIELELLHA